MALSSSQDLKYECANVKICLPVYSKVENIILTFFSKSLDDLFQTCNICSEEIRHLDKHDHILLKIHLREHDDAWGKYLNFLGKILSYENFKHPKFAHELID